MDAELQIRIKSKISIDQITGCWNWNGYIHPDGYGRMSYKKYRSKGVHRLSYLAFKGIFATGCINTLHTCDNRQCVNPEHLYLGDQKQNSRDMIDRKRHWLATEASKTHCKNGHPLSGENLINTNGKKPQRVCRICKNISQQRYLEKQDINELRIKQRKACAKYAAKKKESKLCVK